MANSTETELAQQITNSTEKTEKPPLQAQSTLAKIADIHHAADGSVIITDDLNLDENNGDISGKLSPRSNYAVTFSPSKVAQSKQELMKTVKKNSRENVSARLYRLLVIVAFLVFLLPFTAGTKFQLLQCLAFGELFLLLGYAAHLFGILCKAHWHPERHLYRVYTLNSMPPNWAKMSISYRAILYKSQPLESISEFSAIQGGMASTMLFGTATATLAVVACAFAADIQYENFSFYGTDICILFGSFGLVTIGTFELDPFNKMMIKLHYLGVLFSLGIFVGFNWQIGRMLVTHDKNGDCDDGAILWYPILLDIIALSGFGSWQISLYKGAQYQKYLKENADTVEFNPRKISLFSLLNLASEGVFFIGAGLSLCSWLFFYPINKACRDGACCDTWFPVLTDSCTAWYVNEPDDFCEWYTSFNTTAPC